MSDMWDVRVLERRGDMLVLEFVMDHPDAGDPPEAADVGQSRQFAYRALLNGRREALWKAVRDAHAPGGWNAPQQAYDDADARLNAEVERLENFPLDEASQASLDRELAIYQVREPAYREEMRREYAAATAVVKSAVADDPRRYPFDESGEKQAIEDELENRGLSPDDGDAWEDGFTELWGKLWSDPERLPAFRLTVRVAEAAWLEGLEPGFEFKSTAY